MPKSSFDEPTRIPAPAPPPLESGRWEPGDLGQFAPQAGAGSAAPSAALDVAPGRQRGRTRMWYLAAALGFVTVAIPLQLDKEWITIGWALDGPDAGHGIDGMVFEPNIKLQWQFAKVVAGGIEYYGTKGTLTHMAPADQQSHVIYPALDFFFSEDWELNVGYGIKLAGAGDANIFKVIVGRRFPF